MIYFNFKKAVDTEEPECFCILFERGSEGLGAPPSTIILESQLRFSNKNIAL